MLHGLCHLILYCYFLFFTIKMKNTHYYNYIKMSLAFVFHRCFMGTCWNNFPTASSTLSCPFSLVNCCSPLKFQFRVTSSGELFANSPHYPRWSSSTVLTVCNCESMFLTPVFLPLDSMRGRTTCNFSHYIISQDLIQFLRILHQINT